MSDSASHLLVPTDFSPAARGARQLAFQLAMKSHAQVTLLHVTERPTGIDSAAGFDALGHLHDVLHLPSGQAAYAPNFTNGPDPRHTKALGRLRQEVHPEWQGAIDVRTAWRQGAIVPEILAFIDEAHVDTLVLGTRGRRRFRLSASISDQLLRAAPCRTILVHSPTDAPLPSLALPSLLNGLTALWKRPAVRLSKDG
jgi:nucleotide-binding universal stress UspA family protein